MSRVIKFRGLNAQGEFVYGLPSHDLPNSTSYYSEYSHRICWHLGLRGITNQPIKNGTLGQFTGLHDINGVEIYELSEIDYLYEVNYKNGSYVLINMSSGDIFNLFDYLEMKNGQVKVTKEYTKI